MSSDPHPSVTKINSLLTDAGLPGRVRILPDAAPTAQAAADQLGCAVGAIANSLIFVSGNGEPLLVMTSGAHRVDTAKVAAELGVGSLQRATPEFVRKHTGQVIGGVSPIAHPAPVRTYLDPWLRQYDEIWAAAGHPAAVFSSTFAELQQMTGAAELEME
jgi:prolyl-tRNA editing enzyme YbaK/EbsC (Cys-tRNA(Pro) deacylase)